MKEDIENKIDNYFREGLENFNFIPPAEVWNNIAGNLPQKKSSRKMFLWIAVAASVSLFAAYSGWNYLQRISTSNKIESVQKIANNQDAQQKQNNLQSKSSNNNDIKSNDTKSNTGITSNNEIKSNDKVLKAEENAPVIALQSSQTEQPEHAQNSNTQLRNKENGENVSVEPVVKNKNGETNSGKNVVFSNHIESSNDNIISSISAIDLKSFVTPEVYGKINYGSFAAKIDTAPVYDNLYAYENVVENKEKINRWAIGGHMAPLYSYRNISEVNTPGLNKSSMNQIEKAIVTYSSGVMVDYEASPRLSFQTGIYYMKMGQEIDNVTSFVKPSSKTENLRAENIHMDFALSSQSNGPVAVNSTGTIVANEADNLYYTGSINSANKTYAPGNLALSPADETKKNIEQVFEFIEVPFLAKYKIIDRKINLHLLGGLSTHVLVNNKTILVTEDNSTTHGETTDIETMNYSSSVGFGVGYNLRKNIVFSIEPTFKYYLNSFNSGDAVKLHPYAFGLYSGFSFKF